MPLAAVAVLAFGLPAAPALAGRGTPEQRGVPEQYGVTQQHGVPERRGAARELTSALRSDDERAGLGVQLLDIPLVKIKDPRARAYIVDHLKPGTTIHRRVEVSNTSPDPQHVELYASGASVEGNTFMAPDGRTGNELSGWVKLERASIDIPPGTRKPVKITVAVPKTASEGERYGAVWAQITKPPNDGGNVGQIRRVGVRVYLDIGPGGEPPTDFRIDGLKAEPGTGEWPVVTAQVHNTGGRALDMSGRLSLSSTSGPVKAGPFEVTTGVTILPGQNGQVSAPITQALPPGLWEAKLTLVSGIVERTLEGRLALPPGTADATVESSTSNRLMLASAAAAALALVIAVLVWVLARRRATETRHGR